MERKELICIGCPMGCPVTVEMKWRKRRIGDRKYLSERRALCAERSDGSDPDRDFDRESQRRSRAACACEDKRGYSEREIFEMYESTDRC